MSGIYILKTTDGFRVAYSCDYYQLVDFSENIQYTVNGKVAAKIFTGSRCFETYEQALKRAKIIALNYEETDDGICLIFYAQHLSYGELINETPSGC